MLLAALRRVGCEVALSQGMRPKPVISLALPRAVGVESSDELAAGRARARRRSATRRRGSPRSSSGSTARCPTACASTRRCAPRTGKTRVASVRYHVPVEAEPALLEQRGRGVRRARRGPRGADEPEGLEDRRRPTVRGCRAPQRRRRGVRHRRLRRRLRPARGGRARARRCESARRSGPEPPSVSRSSRPRRRSARPFQWSPPYEEDPDRRRPVRDAGRHRRGQPGRRVLHRARRAPLAARQRVPRPRRQRPARHGGRLRRRRPREERLPVRRRDRAAGARRQGPAAEAHPGAHQAAPGPAGAGRQGPDGHQGRAPDDGALLRRPLPGLRARRAPATASPSAWTRTSASGCATSSRSSARATAAASSSAPRRATRELPELERDLRLLEELWDRIRASAKQGGAPRLVHQEVDLALEMVRDDLRIDVDEVITDDEPTYERIRELRRAALAGDGRPREAAQRGGAAAAPLRGRARHRVDAAPPRRPAVGRLPAVRLRRGVHDHRRQHGPLRGQEPARGHDPRATTSRRRARSCASCGCATSAGSSSSTSSTWRRRRTATP